MIKRKPTFLDFFAGSGLVTEALKPYFSNAWANDICEKKKAVYKANHKKDKFVRKPIEEISGKKLPNAMLSWGSFPCQDLSLAGNISGINGARSGLVWHWLRVMDEMKRRPPIIVAENVVGLVSASRGEYYRSLHSAITKRGYRVGVVILNAIHWVPQSRPRVFIIAIDRSCDISGLETEEASWCHPLAVQKAVSGLKHWVWWKLGKPRASKKKLTDIVDLEIECHGKNKSKYNISLIPPNHQKKLKEAIKAGEIVFPGYKRMRNGRQVLEIRFDGIAGCLRTPTGGSSRQFLVIKQNGNLKTRLLTVNETARLMGVRKGYKIPGTYNDGYKAMGDAVVVPTVRYLAKHLLNPLAQRI